MPLNHLTKPAFLAFNTYTIAKLNYVPNPVSCTTSSVFMFCPLGGGGGGGELPLLQKYEIVFLKKYWFKIFIREMFKIYKSEKLV